MAVAAKRNQSDTSATTNRIALGDFVALSRWDVVNTFTFVKCDKIVLKVGGIDV
ncbi:hypothetical protein [Cohnella soli]|uniref:Uncharacterized protein n=1 Tax=Cohnella soli TaxID=425005 RepID=A0ABW0HQW9_9BACL